jgi:hypothetical protein
VRPDRSGVLIDDEGRRAEKRFCTVVPENVRGIGDLADPTLS